MELKPLFLTIPEGTRGFYEVKLKEMFGLQRHKCNIQYKYQD